MSFFDKILPKKEFKEYFLALCVEEQRISAAVAKISENKVTIIGSGKSELNTKEKEVEAADIAISTAEKNLPPNILIEKVIFGLPLLFIENDKIKPEYLARLKKITKELALTPLGFIEYPIALAYYFENKEESPPTAILLSLGKDQITLSLLRVGKVEYNLTFQRTVSISSDFEKSLSSFKEEILPSRIILYDEADNSPMEEIREELLNFPWHKHTSFLHTPKIEILETEAITTAIVEAAGGNILKELQLEEKSVEKVEKTKEKTVEENFGFVKGEDISFVSQPVERPVASTESKMKITDIIASFKKLLSQLHFDSLSSAGQSISFRFIPLVIIFGIIIASTVLFFWSYPKAIVNIIVYPQISTKQTEVTFTTDSERLKEIKNALPAKLITEDISGEKSASTTGKTNVGEKAQGEVTIYNKTLSSKTFPKGATFINGSLKFTLDADVNVASASDTGEGLTFGKIMAKIISFEIGPEGNLSAGSIFIIKDFPESSFYAKNSQNFSQGSSREVSSVSKNDQDELFTSLSEQLTASAKQKLMQKISSGERILDGSIEKNVVTRKFSKDVGTEAKEVTLSLTLKINALVFQETDLPEVAKVLSSSQAGFTMDNDKTQVKIEELEVNKKGDIKAKATITVYYFPTVEKDKIKSQIIGKSFKQAAELLSKIDYIGGVEIIKVNEFPFFSDSLPYRNQNITIQIVSR